ncbi:MAG: hypothetical protein AAF500_05250 [Myxococcota bacterium]
MHPFRPTTSPATGLALLLVIGNGCVAVDAGTATTTGPSKSKQPRFEGTMSFVGRARDTDAGASILVDDGTVLCANHKSWPAQVNGRRVVAEGPVRDMGSSETASNWGAARVLDPCRVWVLAPETLTTRDLEAWVRQHSESEDGRRRRLRVPVIVEFEDGDRLALGTSVLAFSASEEGATRIELDDSALGVSLVSRARSLCRPEDRACVLGVEGMWGPLIATRNLSRPAFSVLEPPTRHRSGNRPTAAWQLW